MGTVVTRQDGRQAAAGRAFERSEPEGASGWAIAQLAFRFVGQAQQALGVHQQRLALGREHQRAALTPEQCDTEPFFQLLDARGHVALHAVQACRGADHAALARDAAEYLQRVQIEVSHFENDSS